MVAKDLIWALAVLTRGTKRTICYSYSCSNHSMSSMSVASAYQRKAFICVHSMLSCVRLSDDFCAHAYAHSLGGSVFAISVSVPRYGITLMQVLLFFDYVYDEDEVN